MGILHQFLLQQKIQCKKKLFGVHIITQSCTQILALDNVFRAVWYLRELIFASF